MTSTKTFLILYSSQTGQAKAIAEEIHDKAPSFGLKATLFCLSLVDKKFSLEKESCVVFITSTTGDGEPPDTAHKFFRRLNRQTLKKNYLEHLNYALLALGDSNYIKFCLFGRTLETRLRELSARSFYPTGFGDDAYGIENAVDPWIENLWPVLRKQFGLPPLEKSLDELNLAVLNSFNKEEIVRKTEDSSKKVMTTFISGLLTVIANEDVTKVPKLPPRLLRVEFETSNWGLKHVPIPGGNSLPSQDSSLALVNVIAAKRLTHGKDVKTTLELTLRFEEAPISYTPGDSFGFICSNPLPEVNLLLERLNLLDVADCPVNLKLNEETKKIPSHLCSEVSLRHTFLQCVEIRAVPKKILLRILAEYCADEKEKKCLLFLSSASGSKYYTDCVRLPNLSILDILLNYPSCAPPVEALLEYLPSLKPRNYSVASSPLKDPRTFRIVFNLIEIEKGEGRMIDRKGVCTGWLNELSSHSDDTSLSEQFSNLDLESNKISISVYKRQNNLFHFPNSDCPVILICSGTGIAPFIGYLQYREDLNEDMKQNEVWLFYGCRWADKDYLYKNELQRLKENGTLTHLIVSHSRETSLAVKSRYVHESIGQLAAEVVPAVNRGAKIMVCGDALHMARDVQQAFINAFRKESAYTQAEAEAYVTKLQSDRRYVNDVWS